MLEQPGISQSQNMPLISLFVDRVKDMGRYVFLDLISNVFVPKNLKVLKREKKIKKIQKKKKKQQQYSSG